MRSITHVRRGTETRIRGQRGWGERQQKKKQWSVPSDGTVSKVGVRTWSKISPLHHVPKQVFTVLSFGERVNPETDRTVECDEWMGDTCGRVGVRANTPRSVLGEGEEVVLSLKRLMKRNHGKVSASVPHLAGSLFWLYYFPKKKRTQSKNNKKYTQYVRVVHRTQLAHGVWFQFSWRQWIW